MKPEKARYASRYTPHAAAKLLVRSNAGGAIGEPVLRSHAANATKTATPAAMHPAKGAERRAAHIEWARRALPGFGDPEYGDGDGKRPDRDVNPEDR